MSESKVPAPSVGDAAHASLRAILGAIPLGGSAAVELFNWLIKPPLERRRDEWMREVGEQLEALDRNNGIDLKGLQSDPVFIDTLLQASHVAMRNSSNEKHNALRNAICNSAKPGAPDAAMRQMFLRWIDDFNEWHLRILELFHEPRRAWTDDSHTTCSLSYVLETVYPELHGRRSLYDQMWRDLYSAGLVTTDSLHGMMSGRGTLQSRTSDLGKAFLKFIRVSEEDKTD